MSPDAAHHQGAFAAALLDPRLPVPGGVARADSGDPREAFNVYRNNVVASLAEALKAAFPVTAHLLGEGLQRALMADFARAHPPRSPVLSAYGSDFPGFLAQHAATRARAFLADVALLERRRLEAYHEQDAKVLDATELATLSPDALERGRFVVHPAMRLVVSRFPVATIYTIERAALDGLPSATDRAQVDMAQGQGVLVTRPHFDVDFFVLAPGEVAFVRGCARGVTFGEAAAAGLDADPAFDLQACLATCLQTGAFAHFKTEPHAE